MLPGRLLVRLQVRLRMPAFFRYLNKPQRLFHGLPGLFLLLTPLQLFLGIPLLFFPLTLTLLQLFLSLQLLFFLLRPRQLFLSLPLLFLLLTPPQLFLFLPLLFLLKPPLRLFLSLPMLVFLLTPGLFGFRRRRQVPLRAFDQPVDMLIEGLAQRIQPMQTVEVHAQSTSWKDVLDAERDHRCTGVESCHDLVENMARVVRRCRENHDEEFRGADRLDDRGAPVLAIADIARRNPAADSSSLQPVTDGVGGGFVGVGVADEDVVGQAALPSGPERVRPNGIQCQNPLKARAIHRVPRQLPMRGIARKSWAPGAGAHLPASLTFDTSQSLMIQSPLPEASVRPSGEYAAEKTAP